MRLRRLVLPVLLVSTVAVASLPPTSATAVAPAPATQASKPATAPLAAAPRKLVTAKAAATSLPSACGVFGNYVSCTYAANTSSSLSLSSGASDVAFLLSGGGGGGANGGGTPGGGASLNGDLYDVAGKTLKIGVGQQGGNNPLTDFGNFNGGGADPTHLAGTHDGGHGGAASIIGSVDGNGNSQLLVVAGGGGGTGGGYFGTTGGGGGGGGSSDSGNNGTSKTGGTGEGGSGRSGGGGGGGGYYGGTGGGTCSLCAGGGGHGGANANFGLTDAFAGSSNSGNGSATISYSRSNPSVSGTISGDTVYAWQQNYSFPINVTSATGTPTGQVTVTDQFTGAQVCNVTLSNGATCNVPASDLTTGTHPMSISYGGDNGYAARTGTATVEVTADPVTVTVDANKQADGSYELVANASAGINGGMVDGTLSLSSSPASTALSNSPDCAPVRSSAPAESQRDQGLSIRCDPAMIPGSYTITATFLPNATSAAGSADKAVTIAKYTPTGSTLTFQPNALQTYGDLTVATVRIGEPSGAQVDLAGAVAITVAATGTKVCDATETTPVANRTAIYTCMFAPAADNGSGRDYVAVYAGNSYYDGITSDPSTVSTPQTTPTLTLATSPAQVSVGDKLTLTSTAQDPGQHDIASGTVTFYDGPVAPDGSNAVGSVDLSTNPGVATATITPSAGTHKYTAQYVDAAGNYSTVTVAAVPVYVQPLAATMTVTAAGASSAATAAGIPTTVTTEITVAVRDALVEPITMSPAPTKACTRTEATTGGNRVITQTCSYVEKPGTTPTYTATYADDLVDHLTQTENTYVIPASPTSTTVTATSGDYGDSPTFTATVRPTVTGTAVAGRVTVVDGATTLCTVTLGNGNASGTCPAQTPPHAGRHTVVGRFVPTAVTPVLTQASASSDATFTIAADPVSIDLSTSSSSTKLTISAEATVDGGGATTPVPTGSITFTDGASSCGTVTIANGLADCVVTLPDAGTKTTFSARFVPSTDFVAGAHPGRSIDYQRPSSGVCTTGFNNIWTLAQAASNHTLAADAGPLGSVSLTIPSNIGACDAAATLSVKANVSLFGDTVVAPDLTASITQNDGLCLTSGSVSLPSVWHAGALSVTQAVCFPLTAVGGLKAPVSGALSLGKSAATLPLVNIPGVTNPATLTARLGTACPNRSVGDPGTCASPAAAVSLTGVVAAASATVPGVTVTATVRSGGGISAGVTSTPISLFGTSVTLAGSITRASKSDPLSASVSATLADDASPVAGLSVLSGTSITLVGGTGSSPTLQVAGSVQVGSGDSGVQVDVSGSFTSVDDYNLDLDTATPAPTWTPISGLTLSPVLSGSLHRSGGTTQFALSASGSGGSPLATWVAPGGVTVTVNRISLGGDPTKTDLGCTYTGLVAAISGGMSVGNLSVDAVGCISLADHSWHVAANAKTGAVGGLTMTNLVLNATHPAGGTTAVAGSATATLSVGTFSGSTTVTMSVEDGVFVVGGQLDATSLGLPSTSTYLAYASAPSKGWPTGLPSVGDGGTVDLPAGVSLFGSLVLPNAVASVLRKGHFDLPSDATVTFEAAVAPAAKSITFSAALATPSGFPVLTLPAGATIDSASVVYANKTFGLTADGTVRGQDGTPAKTHLAVTISSTGDFSGAASVTALSLLGRTLDLSGAVTRTKGVTAANLTASVAGDITLGDATLSNVTVSLGTDGLAAKGSVAVASTSLAFNVAFASTSSYSLAVSTTVRNWTPASGVTVNATIAGALTHTTTGNTYDFSATPASGSSLITLNPATGVTLALNAFELSNSKSVPGGCTLAAKGDTWLAASASLSVSLGSAHGSATGSGCFDLTTPSFAITVSVPGADFGGVHGKVTLGNLAVTVKKSGAVFTASASARLGVQLPRGGRFSVVAVVTFADGGFAIGGVADLSPFLGSVAAKAYLFYATTALKVDTGDKSVGTLSLRPGVTVGLAFAVSDGVAQALHHFGFDIGSGSSLTATANIDLDNGTVQLLVGLAFQQTNIFSLSNGTYVRADSMSLAMTLSATQPSFGFITSDTLHVPASTPGGRASDVGLTGGISIGTQLTAFLTVSNWHDALGLDGFDLKEFTLQGGITLTGLPLPSLAISATVDGLPGGLANIIGYQQGAPISIAISLGETSLLLDVKIGTKDSTDVALAPLQAFGKASLLSVNYAELYISPTGATIGQTVYPAGFALGFQGQIAGVPVDVFAKVDPAAGSFYFRGSVGQINIGSLVIGPTTLTIDASPRSFDLTFSGHLAIGPSTTDIGPALRFSGYLSADVTLGIGTSGISAHLNFDASVKGSNYLPQSWCYSYGFPYPCNYQWVDDAPLMIHANNIGFAIDSSGLTVDIPNTASHITFPWPTASSFSAGARPLTPGTQFHPAHTLLVSALGRPQHAAPPRKSVTAMTAVPRWQQTGSLGTGRVVAAGLALRNGSVMVAGGAGSGGLATASVELYDPRTGGWQQTTSMSTARTDPSVVELADGRVLVVGGGTGTGHGATASAEIYDPKTVRWTPAGSLSRARQGASAVVLADGTVLVAGGHVGGRAVRTVDLFHPATGRWTVGPRLGTARAAAAAAPLADGDVLIAGGMGSKGPLRSAELYNSATGSWEAAAPMAHARFYASATRLADGRILVAGDANQAETYNTTTGRWALAGSLAAPAQLSSMATLRNGHVLVAGGLTRTGQLTQVDEFDPATNHWTKRAALPSSQAGASTAVLANGNVLVAGGLHGRAPLDSAFVYRASNSMVPRVGFTPLSGSRLLVADSTSTWWWLFAAGIGLVALLGALFLVLVRRRPRSV